MERKGLPLSGRMQRSFSKLNWFQSETSRRPRTQARRTQRRPASRSRRKRSEGGRMSAVVQSHLLTISAIAAILGAPAIAAQQQTVEVRPVAAGASALGALAEIPPGKILVTYNDGQLTIKARNAPLLEILRKACQQIGAEIEVPPGASELVFADLGPGPARAVITSLLTGVKFNYAMEAQAENPNLLVRLSLFPIRPR